jgi:ferritin
MNDEIRDAINAQIGLELHSAYAYLAMSAHFSEQNFEGFAHWMRLQAQEELEHAMRFFDYMLERGSAVALPAVDSPPREFGDPLSVFELALEHEQKVTAAIHAIYDLARESKDYATELQLQWFVTEQVEEEASAGLAIEKLRRAGEHEPTLLLLDTEFGARQPE